jgi:hypothetical protein
VLLREKVQQVVGELPEKIGVDLLAEKLSLLGTKYRGRV